MRADAARNSAKIVQAAREVYAERGPDAPLEEIAGRAGVGIATLFRRFPDKGVLLRAVLDQAFVEQMMPALGLALRDEDPRHGLAVVLETALASAVRDYNVLTAARNAGVLTAEIGDRFFDALDPLVRQGQRAGVIREDLVLEDVRRIMVMLVSVLWTMEPGEGGWQRYVTLLLDGLSPAAASALPNPAPAIVRPQN
ncbi:TetR/AcrR family transcriptional regulator [Streptomyces sp. NPDC008222]|uniref:TetR/AcrR family transcriptional regulator n=1 Tax=Streptomyces sp. NPDC008222 TaxID=3364820 RepID=UPI0036E85AC0